MSQKSILPFALCGALLATACSDDHADYDDRDGPRPEPSFGTLQLNWTIDGRTDAAGCEALGATAFEILVFDAGYFVTQLEPPCEDFETRLELYVDDYVTRVTLIDAYDRSVTRRSVEDYFEIEEGQVTQLPVVDFSSDLPGSSADAGATTPDAGSTAPDDGTPPAVDVGPTPPVADAGADATLP